MPGVNRKIRVLLFSTLYPSSVRPGHGIFVETRLRHLLTSDQIEVRVVAPVPWFPLKGERYGGWARLAATPTFEKRNGIDVWHPRYFLPPKIGMNIAPLTLAQGARITIAKLIKAGFDFDLIDAHYYYPDGVAAALLARWFNKPFVVTARGSDLNLLPQYAIPRRWIQWAESKSAASIGVCRALMDELILLGGDSARMHVLRNGVDLLHFQPHEQVEARYKLGLPEGRLMLCVGHLVELKGHHLAIEALCHLPDVRLVIVGDGVERSKLIELAKRLSVSERVIFAGAQSQVELPYWYSAADVLVLCSSREGWANVLLESMACGTPVVATRVGGTPEVIQNNAAGRLMSERSAPELVAQVRALFSDYPLRQDVRAYAEQFDWAHTTCGQLALFERIVGARNIVRPTTTAVS